MEYARGSNSVCPFYFPSCQIIFDPAYDRLFTIVAHIPWLITYLRFIPGAAKVQTRVFAIAEKYVNHRVEQGSNIKDLFYYLVSSIVLFEPSIHTGNLDRRGGCGTEEAIYANRTIRRSPRCGCWF